MFFMAKITAISITLPENLLKRIDEARGMIKRSNYISSALEAQLKKC